ncbi:receptor-like protein Cf-9 homolog [Hevea brasiliensis]|uniref:receptor-like protein Cf-9 homolog n=1 Tax=Hevea brasiliensis TaxID=3981 RepID=UPI0025F27E02|nr:receptor-like protein Cf-9 homolog [Hevea brasiliensis]
MSLDPLDNQNLMLDTIVFNKLVQNLPNLREVDLSYANMFLAEPISLMNLSSSLSSLQLMDCGLQGEFPGKLLQRPKLRVLDLRGNDRCLPRSNWSCSLETLYLSYTKIAIHLEHDLISNLRSVKRLSLGGMNNFHGSIRTSFSNNNSFMYLNFNGNLLEGRIPSSITNCKNLEVLDIGNNKIDDTFPIFWQTLKQLQVLILQSNKLYGSLKDAIGNYSFSKLRIFDISSNSSSGPWPLEYFISLEAMIVPNQEIEYMRVGSYEYYVHVIWKEWRD